MVRFGDGVCLTNEFTELEAHLADSSTLLGFNLTIRHLPCPFGSKPLRCYRYRAYDNYNYPRAGYATPTEDTRTF